MGRGALLFSPYNSTLLRSRRNRKSWRHGNRGIVRWPRQPPSGGVASKTPIPGATLGSLGSLREPAIQHGRLAGSEEQGGWYGVRLQRWAKSHQDRHFAGLPIQRSCRRDGTTAAPSGAEDRSSSALGHFRPCAPNRVLHRTSLRHPTRRHRQMRRRPARLGDRLCPLQEANRSTFYPPTAESDP